MISLSSSFTGDNPTFVILKQPIPKRESFVTKLPQEYSQDHSGIQNKPLNMAHEKTKGMRITRVDNDVGMNLDHSTTIENPREQRLAVINSKFHLKTPSRDESTSDTIFTTYIDGLIGLNGFSGVISNKTKEARSRKIKRKIKSTNHDQG